MATIGNTNKSRYGRRSDSLLPPGISQYPQKQGRIQETLPGSGGNATPVGVPPEDEVFIITQEIAAAAITIPYTFTIQAVSTNGSQLVYSVDSGQLPEGILLDPDGGFLYGTSVNLEEPTFVLKVAVKDVLPEIAAFHTYTMVSGVAPLSLDPLSITSDPIIPNAVVGQPFKFVFQGYSAVAGTLVWSVNPGSTLPAGLLLDPGGTLVGLATEVGMFTFDVDLDDGVAPTVTQTVTLNLFAAVQGLIVININSPITTALENQYYSFLFTSVGQSVPVGWSVTGGPAGLILNGSTGQYAGAATENGVFTLIVTADNGVDIPATKTFELTVLPDLPTISVTTPSDFYAGQSVNVQWQITDPLTFTPSFSLFVNVGGVPIGPLDVTPVDGGSGNWSAWVATPYSTPTGSYQFVVAEAVTGVNGFSGFFTVNPYPAITFTTASPLPNATTGVAYSHSIVATGGLGSLTYSATGLPAPLVQNAAGLITGLPGASGTFSFVAHVTDGFSPIVSQNYNLYILDPAAIVITSQNPLPDGFEGAVYSFQFTQSGGTSPTWSIVAGSVPGLNINGAGLFSGTATTGGTYSITVKAHDGIAPDAIQAFDITIQPSLGTAWVKLVARDGAEIVIREGDSFTLTNGSALQDINGVPTGATLNLASASLNAPGTNPGLKCRMTFGDWEILNTGWSEGLGTPQTNGVGHPFYWEDVKMYCPGRQPMFGAEYMGAVDLGGGIWHLVRPSDAKFICRHNFVDTVVGGIARYTPSRSNHMIDGGEAIYYRMVPLSDPHDTLPSVGDFNNCLTVLNLDPNRRFDWPLLQWFIDLHRHEPSTYNVATAVANTTTLTWNTWQPNHHATHPGTATNLNPNPYMGWYGSMFVMNQQNSNGTNLRAGWYNVLVGFATYCCLNQTDQATYDYFMALLRRMIVCGLKRFDSASLYKGLWCSEGSDTQISPTIIFGKVGTGATFYPGYEKNFGTALVLGKMLNPTDPLISDAFDRVTASLLANTYSYLSGPASIAGGLRQCAHYLNALWRYYHAHVILGNAGTAASLKTKATNYIEQIFVARDQSATCAAAMGVATKVNWPPSTITPNTTPITSTAAISATVHLPAMAGYGECFFPAVTHWMVDEGTNAGRLADWKVIVEWWFTHNYRNIGTGIGGTGIRYQLAYRMFPDMSGGGATWNNQPLINTIGNEPTFNGYFHASWEIAMEPYMTAWFPGSVAPGGTTWAVYWERMARTGWEDPSTTFLSNPLSSATSGGSTSGSGALNYDIWAGKHTSIFTWGSLA